MKEILIVVLEKKTFEYGEETKLYEVCQVCFIKISFRKKTKPKILKLNVV